MRARSTRRPRSWRAGRLGPVAQRRRDRARPDGAGCELAVGCGYKYLNGGPGAPAFIYRRRAPAGRACDRRCRAGWAMPSRSPSLTNTGRRRASLKFLTGTPSILALAALDAGLATFDGIAMAISRRSRVARRSCSSARSKRAAATQVRLASPRDPTQRGSHVVFAHPEGYAVMQALIARGVIGDFRAPDLMRFGFAPLYNSLRRNGPRRRNPRRYPASRRMGSAALQVAREGYLSGAFRVRAPSTLHAPAPAAAK